MTDWRFSFPDVAAELRAWITNRARELERGDIRTCREALRSFSRWIRDHDLRGAPEAVCAEIGRLARAAADELQEPGPDPVGAQDLLEVARGMV